MVCWALKWFISNVTRQKVNLLNMDASYVNYFTIPLPSYSLHCFLLIHWRRSDHGGCYMPHRLPCRSTFLCKQVLCCWQEDVLHLQVISSRRLTGAGAFVIGSSTRSSQSLIHPWPSSDPRSRITSRARPHPNAW